MSRFNALPFAILVSVATAGGVVGAADARADAGAPAAGAPAPSSPSPPTPPSSAVAMPAPPAAPLPVPARPAVALPLPPPSAEVLDARLAAARRRLEAAAREVAELSMTAGAGRGDRLVFRGDPPRRAILGLQVDPANSSDGARVLQVSPGGPAALAGLQGGDVLVSIGDVALAGRDDPARALVEYLASAEPEQKLTVKLLRAGRARTVEVTPRRSPMPLAARGAAGIELPPLPPLPAESPAVFEWVGDAPSVAGLELASMTTRLGSYFGTVQGVLVVRAPQQPAWQLEDGDVILAIDGRQPTSGAHASRILRSYQAGEALQLRLMRQRKPLELRVVVPQADAIAAPRVKVVRMQRILRDGEPAPDTGSGEMRIEPGPPP